MECGCRGRSRLVGIDVDAMKRLTTGGGSGGELEFRRQLIEERQHQGDATISHQNHIFAPDKRLARRSIAPSQAPAFVEQFDRPKLTENVVREALLQGRGCTIEFVASVALAVMIDEYAIFGPQFGDRRSSFLGVSFAEHFVKIAFDEGLDRIRHSSLPYSRGTIPLILNASSRRYGAGSGRDSRDGRSSSPA